MAKKKAAKKKKKSRVMPRAPKENPVERKLILVEVFPRDVPEHLYGLWDEEDQWYLKQPRWSPSMLDGSLHQVRQRLDALEQSVLGYERLDLDLSYDQDYDLVEMNLQIQGKRWETDEEYEKRKQIVLKRRETQRKNREKAAKEKRQKEAAQKKAEAEKKKKQEEADYKTYLELKERFGGNE